MNLGKKKNLAAKALDTGKGKIVFVKARLEDIKEAITKQDIKDLQADGAIMVKAKKGKRKIQKRKKKKGPGKIKKNVNKRKQEYVKLTRKLRAYIVEIKKQGKITNEISTDLRKRIRNSLFRSKAHMKEFIKANYKEARLE